MWPSRRCAKARRAIGRWSRTRPKSSWCSTSTTARFIDVNDNAVRFFKMDREALLAMRPGQDQPAARSPTARRPFGAAARLSRRRARWRDSGVRMDCTAMPLGNDIPCEVRFVRLPSSTSPADPRQHHRHHRAQAGRTASRPASGGCSKSSPPTRTLSSALEAITEVIERVAPESYCAISLLDQQRARSATVRVAPRLPREFVRRRWKVRPSGPRYGSCAAAVYLGAPGDRRRHANGCAVGAAARARAALPACEACWSTPIVAGGRPRARLHSSMYRRQTGMPGRRDLELMSRMTQLAGIAIERRRAEDALRSQRGEIPRPVRKRHGGRVPDQPRAAGSCRSTRRSCRSHGLRFGGGAVRSARCGEPVLESGRPRRRSCGASKPTARFRNAEYPLRRRDGTSSIAGARKSRRVVRDEQARVIGYEGTIADITERKKAETAVLRGEGARAGHAAVDRRRRHHHRRRWPHRVYQSGGRKPDRLGDPRGRGTARRGEVLTVINEVDPRSR